MNAFIRVHEEQLLGKLTMFDRMIFRGHLNKLYFGEGAFEVFLWRQGVPLKDFGPYVEAATRGLKAHAQQAAAAQGRPYVYLAGASTKASGHSKHAYPVACQAIEECDCWHGPSRLPASLFEFQRLFPDERACKA